MPMKPTPAGWPRISSSAHYRDPARMIDWLCEAFGFELRLKVEGDDGSIQHSELTFGDAPNEAVVMVSGVRRGVPRFGADLISPLDAGGNTQSMMIYVDDVDAHCEQARRGGARVVSEPEVHDYGDDYWSDRSYGCLDPEGHVWWIAQRLRG